MIPDYCTEAGARKLAQRIKAYWTERGYAPPAMTLAPGIACKSNGSSICGVRSDMVGGMPRRRVGAS